MKRSLILFILFFLTYALHAEEIAISTFVLGDVSITKAGKTRKLKVHEQIEKKDKVSTRKGKVEIQIGKNIVISLIENSEIILAEFFEEGETSITALQTKEGKVFAKIVKPLGKKSKFEIESPSHVAGVRGTEFVFSADDDAPAAGPNTEEEIPEGIYVNEGNVEVTDKSSGDKASAGPQEQVVFTGKEMQKGILAEFMKEKMRIFKTLNVMKEDNYRLLKEQIESNKALLREMR